MLNLPGWRWARIKQLALVGSSSSRHSEACKALGGSFGVVHSKISVCGSSRSRGSHLKINVRRAFFARENSETSGLDSRAESRILIPTPLCRRAKWMRQSGVGKMVAASRVNLMWCVASAYYPMHRSHFGSRFVIRLMRSASLFDFFCAEATPDLRAGERHQMPRRGIQGVDCARTGSLLKCFPCFASDRIDKLSYPR